MRDDEGRGHDLEAEHAAHGRLLHPRTGERAEASAREVSSDTAQDFREIGPGAAARIEHIDVLCCESIGDTEVVPHRPVHASDHVADHLRRRVPDAQLLTQLGVEGFQKRLIEVGHGLAFGEAGEKHGPVNPIEGGGRPVQHFDQPQRLQATRIGELLEQCPQHRRAQMPDGRAPVELRRAVSPGKQRAVLGGGVRARPEHPGGEHAIEQRLHQRRMKEPRPPLTLEADPERVFQRRAHRRKRGRLARRLDPREPVTRIRREQPRQVLWLGQRRAVRQRPGEIFAQARAHRSREGPRCFESAHERVRIVG